MAQIDGTGQQDTDNQNAEALQAALAQREVTPQGQPQGGSDVPSHQNSDPVVRQIGNSTLPAGSYRKTSCTVGRARDRQPTSTAEASRPRDGCRVAQPTSRGPASGRSRGSWP